jgi:hypothetical protein
MQIKMKITCNKGGFADEMSEIGQKACRKLQSKQIPSGLGRTLSESKQHLDARF